LLYSVQPEVAHTIANAVASSPATTSEARENVRKLALDLGRLGPLINFTIVIYHDAERAAMARQLKVALKNFGLAERQVRVEQRLLSFDGYGGAHGFHYRFDQVYEREPAEYLGRVLEVAMPAEKFKPLPVDVTGPRTDGSLTIFLFKPSA
jgi:hypothetical protein